MVYMYIHTYSYLYVYRENNKVMENMHLFPIVDTI